MARSIMEVAFLGIQKTEVEEKRYVKFFYGDEPNGKNEHGLAVIGMNVSDDFVDEVFAACANFDPLELVRVSFDVSRGGKNLGKNIVLHVEAVKPKAATPATAVKPEIK